MKFKYNRGDTIVEVLLALTIVSSMLGGAYVLANRSLNNSRASQERGEALKLVEAQLERLNNAVNSGNNDAFTTPNTFCMDSSGNVADAKNPASGTIPPLDLDDFTTYTAACVVQNQSLPYYVSIKRTSDNRFSAYGRWDRLGSAGQNEVKITHGVYLSAP